MTSETAASSSARSSNVTSPGAPILLCLVGALVYTVGGIAGSILDIPELRTAELFSLHIFAGLFVWQTFRLTVPVYVLLQWRASRSHTSKHRSFANLARAARIAFARRRFLAWYALIMTVVALTLIASAEIELAAIILAVLAAIVLLPFAFNLKAPWRWIVILSVCAMAGIFYGPPGSQSQRDFRCRGDAGLVTVSDERLPCDSILAFSDYDLIAVKHEGDVRLFRAGDVTNEAFYRAILADPD